MRAIFNLNSEEAYNYLLDKKLKISYTYKDLEREAHNESFTAAGIMKTDILNDIHDALLKAQKDGVGFNEFKRSLKATLSEKGWYGQKDIVNPLTGETRTININSTRLKTIYTTNMQRAYNLSRATVMMGYTYKVYWLYKSAKLSTSRSSHSKMHNIAIHKDDAWWLINYPPNDYNCKCYVIPISEKEARKYKIMINPPNIANEQFAYDKRVGVSNNVKTQLSSSLDKLPKNLSYENLSDEEALNKVYERFNAKKGELLVDKIGDVIKLDDMFFMDKKKNTLKIKKNNRHLYIDYFPKLLNDPDEIYLEQYVYDKKSYIKKTYLKHFLNEKGKKRALVMIVNQRGEYMSNKTLFLNGDDKYFNKLKTHKLIYKKR